MGFFQDRKAKREAEAKRVQQLRASHARGLDRLPGHYKWRLVPKLAFLHLLQSAIPGVIFVFLFRKAVEVLQDSDTLAGTILLLLSLLPGIFLVVFGRRLVETLTLRFDVFGGMVTGFDTESEEVWDDDKKQYRTVTTYFLYFNRTRRHVSFLRYLTVKPGDYCLLARYLRRYESSDVYLSFKTSPDAENDRLTSDIPQDPIRLYSGGHVPAWSVIVPTMLFLAAIVLMAMAEGAKKADSLLYGLRPSVWMLFGWLVLLVTAGIIALGWHIRFSKERRELEQKKRAHERSHP